MQLINCLVCLSDIHCTSSRVFLPHTIKLVPAGLLRPTDIFALLRCYAALIGNKLQTFRDNLSVPSSAARIRPAQTDCCSFEGATDRLSRNVGKYLAIDAANIPQETITRNTGDAACTSGQPVQGWVRNSAPPVITCSVVNTNIYGSFATRMSQLKMWYFLVIGTERNVCRCTFNRYSVITQFAKHAAGGQLCRRCTHRKV